MMPVVFVGHGSPMNAIENNEYTAGWKKIAATIPKPTAILVMSAHWTTKGIKVSTVEQPETIHDFYGFPKELYDIQYPAKGSRDFAFKTLKLLEGIGTADKSWGLDHGTWSVLRAMYPEADIPVYQLSIDWQSSPQELYSIGKKIKSLREDGVLVIGSGNIVHNLGIIDFSRNEGYEWAQEFNEYINAHVERRDFKKIFNYRELGGIARLSVPTTEHFYPLIYILGLTDENDKLTIYNDTYVAGSLSMTSYVFSQK